MFNAEASSSWSVFLIFDYLVSTAHSKDFFSHAFYLLADWICENTAIGGNVKFQDC